MSQTTPPEDEFQKELLGLFAVEAYEWLGQILTAVVRLEEVRDPSSAPESLDTIVRGLTSLGGSAATVDLPGIQERVFGLLPAIESLRAADGNAAADTLGTVRETLAHITAAVAERTGTPATVSFDVPRADLRRAKDFLAALESLRQAQPRWHPHQRHVIDSISKRVQKDLDRGVSQVDRDALRKSLDEAARSDEDLLGRLQLALPAISSAVTALKATALSPASVSMSQWKSLLDTIDQLVELSRQKHAPAIMQFFSGLSTFVRIATDRRMAISERRFDLVEARVGAVLDMAKAWSEHGHKEREAVAQLVPA